MLTVKFYLKNPKIKGKLRANEVSIYAKITEGVSNRFELRTNEKIEPKFWDFKSQQVKSTYRGHLELNTFLQDFKLRILKLNRDNQNLSFSQLKALAQNTPTEEKKTLFLALDKFIQAYSAEKDKKTVAKYRTMREQLIAFSQVYDFDLNTLDFNFYDKFKEHLYAIPNPNYRNYCLCTIGDYYGIVPSGSDGDGIIGLFDDTVYKYIINLKTFLAWAEKRGHAVNQSYKSWEIITRKHAPISLTMAELEKLENADLPTRGMQIARDYLVMECRTGQRISDIKRFDLKDYNDFKWTFSPRKGNRISSKTVTVYFKGYCAPALEILSRNNWKMPVMSEQKINQNIKLACKEAGIDQMITIYRWAQNKRIAMTFPKYELISTHNGRKTFITIALQYMPPKLVMDLVGIGKYDTLKHYEGQSESSVVEKYLEGIQESKSIMKKAQ